MRHHEIGELDQDTLARRRRLASPAPVFEGSARRRHGGIDVRRVATRHLGQLAPVDRRDAVKARLALGPNPLASDESPSVDLQRLCALMPCAHVGSPACVDYCVRYAKACSSARFLSWRASHRLPIATPNPTTATVTVATTLTEGFKPSRARENSTSGRVVVPGPDKKAEVTTSSNEIVNVNSQADTSACPICGKVTR